MQDPNMFWDFISLRPETTHQVCFLFSDRGIPDGFRHMDGFGSHTFKMVNAQGKAVYVKFHMKTNQGIKNLPADKAHRLAADDPDYSIHDLYNAIADGKCPSWSVFIQVMTFEEAEKFRWNPFDLTKVWPHSQFPLIPVGKLVLDKNPKNYFNDVEQIAFSPANMVPGIEPSPDKMLQGRLFSYTDTHRHRLGPNYPQIPVNCPLGFKRTYARDGFMNVNTAAGGSPNYFPNSFHGPTEVKEADSSTFHVSGDVQRYDSSNDCNFTQVDMFWSKVLKPDERQRLVQNIAGHLQNAAPFIQERAIKNFGSVNPEFGRMLRETVNKNVRSSL